jgi:lipopolysaccharide transport system ATP-binding protein
MSEIAIKIEGLSKRYRIGQRKKYKTFRESIVSAATSPFRRLTGNPSENGEASFWALKEVGFEVRQGDVVGIIGRNGAGKSTLLKILSRITEPTEGKVEIAGRVGSLLEVGTGFHPELTGRENIYLNGAILGMKTGEIQRKFDEIVAFAETEKFLDTPVKHYSSGMYTRLAFAVAAHLEPEILVVDEVLAVGDVQFQKKCLGKMSDVAKGGRTILFVSHNMAAIENLCNVAVLLNGGSVVTRGDTKEVIGTYLERILPASLAANALADRKDRSGNGKVRLVSFHIEDENRVPIVAARSGATLAIVLGFKCPGQPPANVDIGISFASGQDQMLFVLYSSYVREAFRSVPAEGEFRCVIPKLPLAPGRYTLGARVTAGNDEADWPWNGVGMIDVEGGDFFGTGHRGFEGAPILVAGEWTIEQGAK